MTRCEPGAEVERDSSCCDRGSGRGVACVRRTQLFVYLSECFQPRQGLCVLRLCAPPVCSVCAVLCLPHHQALALLRATTPPAPAAATCLLRPAAGAAGVALLLVLLLVRPTLLMLCWQSSTPHGSVPQSCQTGPARCGP